MYDKETEEYLNSKEFKLAYKRLKNKQCSKCGKPMKNGYDSIAKKISEYIWERDCHPKGLQLCIG